MPKEACEYILNYTIGNDLLCCFFQLPKQSGRQFFYVKAFDKFAPIGLVLVSPGVFDKGRTSSSLVTQVNRIVKQDTVLGKDMIFPSERILSWMSQSILTLCIVFLNPHTYIMYL